MKKLSKILLVSLCIMFFLSLSMNSLAQRKASVAMVTGGVAGSYYPLGGTICEAVNEALPDIEVTVLTGAGSVGNINLIWQHEIDSGLSQNNIADWAYHGTVLYEGKEPIKNLRAIASLFVEHIHVVSLTKSKIKTVEDIKGKEISVSDPGSGCEADAKIVLGEFGIKWNDFKPVNLDQATSADYMRDKHIDGMFLTGAYPFASVLDLSQTRDISLLEFTDEEIAKLREKYPYYVKSVIPAGTYKGIDRDIQTIAVLGIWVVDAETDEEVVYEITKALFKEETLEKIHAGHSKLKDVTLKTALNGISIPFHSGAVRYYKEEGLWDPNINLE